jgi:hypothetical protein
VFKWLAAGAAVAVALPIILLLLVAAAPTASQAGTSLAGGPSVAALSGIPSAYLALYMGAARTCPGLSWAYWPASARSKATTASPPLRAFSPVRTMRAPRARCANGAASGTSGGIRQAIFAYNHAQTYVNDVLGWAARYTIPVRSSAAATAVAFALRQIGKHNLWGNYSNVTTRCCDYSRWSGAHPQTEPY